MGSTGSSRFTDYPGSNAGGDSKDSNAEGGSGSTATGADSDDCRTPIDEFELEDVERCAYFVAGRGVPPAGTDVHVRNALDGGRLTVATVGDDTVIGYVPTRLNRLWRCVRSGYSYPGEVTGSSAAPLAGVTVQLTPTQ